MGGTRKPLPSTTAPSSKGRSSRNTTPATVFDGRGYLRPLWERFFPRFRPLAIPLPPLSDLATTAFACRMAEPSLWPLASAESATCAHCLLDFGVRALRVWRAASEEDQGIKTKRPGKRDHDVARETYLPGLHLSRNLYREIGTLTSSSEILLHVHNILCQENSLVQPWWSDWLPPDFSHRLRPRLAETLGVSSPVTPFEGRNSALRKKDGQGPRALFACYLPDVWHEIATLHSDDPVDCRDDFSLLLH